MKKKSVFFKKNWRHGCSTSCSSVAYVFRSEQQITCRKIICMQTCIHTKLLSRMVIFIDILYTCTYSLYKLFMHRGEKEWVWKSDPNNMWSLSTLMCFFLPADQTLESSDEEQTRRAVYSHNISCLNHTTVRKKVGINLLFFCLLSSLLTPAFIFFSTHLRSLCQHNMKATCLPESEKVQKVQRFGRKKNTLKKTRRKKEQRALVNKFKRS